MTTVALRFFIFLMAGWNNPGQSQILLNETFDYPDGELPDVFWSEGCKGVVKNRKLFVDADTTGFRASTIWLDREFSGDMSVEFDAHVVSSGDTANNINFFIMYADPNGTPLRKTASERASASYRSYHRLDGYIFTNVANGDPENARYRFRDNPGFNLLGEAFGGTSKIGETYHIKISRVGNRFRYRVNDRVVLDIGDDRFNPVHERGLMGIRTWHTALWIDNLIIKRLVE